MKPFLEAEGHTVLSPTLTGLGERSGELSSAVSLQTHIDDIITQLDAHPDKQVVLVGHSYGGMIVTAVADQRPERIAHLVYLDAAIPRNGQSMIMLGAPKTEDDLSAARQGLLTLSQDGGVSMGTLPPNAFGIDPTHPLYNWVAERLTPHPMRTWLDPIVLSENRLPVYSRTYIHCVEPVLPQSSFPYFAANLRDDPTWAYHELRTGHDAMITAPEAFSEILLELATV